MIHRGDGCGLRVSSRSDSLPRLVIGALLLSCIASAQYPVLADGSESAADSTTASSRDGELDESRLEKLEKRLKGLEEKLGQILEELNRRRQRAQDALEEIHYDGKPLSAWIRDLGDRKESVQKDAKKALVKIGDDAVPELITAIEKGDRLRSQNAAITVLSVRQGQELKLSEATPIFDLLQELADSTAVTRYLGTQNVSKEAFDLVLRHTSNTHRAVRVSTARLLGTHAKHSIVPDGNAASLDAASRGRLSRAVRALTDLLRDTDASVRSAAIEQLPTFASIAKPAHGALFSVMDNNETGEAIQAAMALIDLKSTETRRIAKFLASQLNHEDDGIVERIVKKLGGLGPDALVATAVLVSKILPDNREETSGDVRIQAAIALVKIHPEGAAAWNEHVVDTLLYALRSSSAVEAIEALAALGPAANKAKDSLQKIVDGSVPRRRTTSVRRTGSSRTASSALQEKLREKARQALEKVKIDAEQPEEDTAENRGDERGSKPIRTAPK